MTFEESIRTCLTKYADFGGRASRSEYWWFILFVVAVDVGGSLISDLVATIFVLAMLVPMFAAATRRLHDTNRSGWWQLIVLLPVIGLVVLIVLLAQDTRPAPSAPGLVA